MIPMAKPLFDKDEFSSVKKVLESGMLIQGEEVYSFEKSFAKYIGCKEAIATNSGTSALHTMLLAAGIKQGHEIITPSFSFVASANSIVYCNAKPVFIDVDAKTFNVDESLIEKVITPKTKAILIVHLFGNPCNMKPIQEIAEKHNLLLFEDCCQSHGAEFEGKRVGSFGIGAFSFYPSKNITTGEGGMITTDSPEVAEKARNIRQQGTDKRYYFDILGYNYRMTNLAAAIGNAQLKKLETFNEARIKNARKLNQGLKDLPIEIPYVQPNSRHVYNQYTIKLKAENKLSRDDLKKALAEKGISSDIYYPLPIHQQNLYVNELGYKVSLPLTEQLSKQVLSIPVHPALKEEELNLIIDSMNAILKR